MADDPVSDVARAAARRLVPEFGARVETDVEAALYARGSDDTAQQFDPVSVGILIVAIATLAWDVYTNHRDKATEAVAPRIRTEIRREFEMTPDSVKITDVVIEELTGGGSADR